MDQIHSLLRLCWCLGECGWGSGLLLPDSVSSELTDALCCLLGGITRNKARHQMLNTVGRHSQDRRHPQPHNLGVGWFSIQAPDRCRGTTLPWCFSHSHMINQAPARQSTEQPCASSSVKVGLHSGTQCSNACVSAREDLVSIYQDPKFRAQERKMLKMFLESKFSICLIRSQKTSPSLKPAVMRKLRKLMGWKTKTLFFFFFSFALCITCKIANRRCRGKRNCL